jgi:hypothetical protein
MEGDEGRVEERGREDDEPFPSTLLSSPPSVPKIHLY